MHTYLTFWQVCGSCLVHVCRGIFGDLHRLVMDVFKCPAEIYLIEFLSWFLANLAVFMITREESPKFLGLHDPRVCTLFIHVLYDTTPNFVAILLLKECRPVEFSVIFS